MELKIGEPYRTDAITIEDDLFHWSKKHTLIESYITEAPFEKLCSDDVMVTARLRIGHANFICTESLHLTPIPLSLLSTNPSNLQAFHESSGDIRGYDHPFNPYSVRPREHA